MKIKPGFEMRDVCGDNIIIGHGEENIDFSRIISLNESAALIWNGVQDRDFTVQDMAALLTTEYDVTEEQALVDAEQMAIEWKEIGLIEG